MSSSRIPPLPISVTTSNRPTSLGPRPTVPAPLLAAPVASPTDRTATRRLDRGRLSLTDIAEALGWPVGTALVAELDDHHRVILRSPVGTEAGRTVLDRRCRVALDRHLRAWMELALDGLVLVLTR